MTAMQHFTFSPIRQFRKSQQAIALLLMPFLLVYANGMAMVWLIYQWEWEDIVTHHCQQFSTTECDGKAYVNAVLDARHGDDTSLPRPPSAIQELRALIPTHVFIPHSRFAKRCFAVVPVQSPHPGFSLGVFRPPCL